jgi:hypothetical protein
MIKLQELISIATSKGYVTLDHQPSICMISFTRPGVKRINVYYSTMTVATCIEHPVKGKTQLFRRNVICKKELDKIFTNPRTHTNKGYYERQDFTVAR